MSASKKEGMSEKFKKHDNDKANFKSEITKKKYNHQFVNTS